MIQNHSPRQIAPISTRQTILETHDLGMLGFHNLTGIHHNLSPIQLVEQAIARNEGWLSEHAVFIAHTGTHTGRSAKDKFVVHHPDSSKDIWWNSPYQKKLEPQKFQNLLEDVLGHFEGSDPFVLDAFAGADNKHRIGVRVVTTFAWHNLFARNMFIPTTALEAQEFAADWTVICAPNFKANPVRHGSRSETQIVISLEQKLVVIVGTSYAGEIKKSIFTVLNHTLPAKNIMPMHCSANVGKDGDVALFFGMSGTGKTTLSADESRGLIGDDEHGWSDHGVFNFEGGCYAKVINLSAKAEPQIFATTQTFGTVLENVVFDLDTRALDLNDGSLTENTRSAYPLSQIRNAVIPSCGAHPNNIVFLAADAFGVLPAISRLTPVQAMYYFLNGYTAKVAGTEKGINEPQASFETAFGAPFLTREPHVYAEMLRRKIATHGARVWLVNTGWFGGQYGVGSRIKLEHTRAIVSAALEGRLNNTHYLKHPIFNLEMPVIIPGVPSDVLEPRASWADGAAYDAQARKLAGMFVQNFAQFEASVSEAVRNAGPRV
jgi:phosphoenolpyruvate carboxykinase (ATP)